MENNKPKPQVKDGSVIMDPEGNYYDPAKNLNTGGQSSVVMIGGKAVEVKDGQIIKKEKTDEELIYEKDNAETPE